VIAALAWAALSLVWPDRPVHVHVRWRADIGDALRVELERRFQLTDPRRIEGSSWEYQLANSATVNIRALVQDERVDDTAHLNRIRYRPEFAQDRQRQIVAYAFAIGGIGAVLFIWAAGIPRIASRPALWATELAAALSRPRTGPSPTVVRPLSARMTAAAILAAAVVAMAMTSFAGASFWSAVAALIAVYVAGYVGGALLVRGREDLSLAVIRTVAGLLLAAVAFLLSLVLSLPWWLLPVALVAATVWLRGRDAFLWPPTASFQWDGIAAGILAVILLAPIAITFFCMAPGSYPPVFYNIDTAYFLEKVHALVAANTFPPESLSNVGVRRTYHYGTQAMAALISRSSGLLPHHAVFLIVLPLLSAGVVAAAFAVARHVSPAVPRSVAVPLLLLSIPSLSQPFWSEFSARVRTTAASGELSIAAIAGDYALWGFLSNEGQNVGGDFMILGSIGLFLTVHLGASSDTAPDHLSMIELTLMPRDWQNVVF
jgi:hypothetical protein